MSVHGTPSSYSSNGCRCVLCSEAQRQHVRGEYERPVRLLDVLTPEVDRSWMDEAECRGADPRLFFPARGESIDPARSVCRACPVAVECLEHAIDQGERFGVWGGASERERRRIRRGAIAS